MLPQSFQGWIAALDFLSFGAASIALFAAFWVLVNPREGRTPDSLLALILVLLSANTLHPLVMLSGKAPGIAALEPLQYLFLASLLWYVRSLDKARWWGFELLVLIPPVVFIFVPMEASRPIYSIAFWVILVAAALILLAPLSISLHRHRARLKTEYSNLQGVDPGWLAGFLRLLWLVFGLYALCLAFLVHAPHEFPLRRLLSAAMGLLAVYLAWKALGRKARAIPTARTEPREDFHEELRGDLVLPQREKQARLLEALLREKGLFRDPEITLDDLAGAAGLSRHDTSAALNQGLGSSFYDLVNACRIDEFKRLAGDPSRAEEKILSLAFEAGFNSKPTFNLVFKKLTGETPSQFRKRMEIVSNPDA